MPIDELTAAPLVYVTGTGLVRDPSRSMVLGILERRVGRQHTVFDLDWRANLWGDRAPEYRALAHIGARLADVVIGGDSEFAAAGLSPAQALALGARIAVAKHGPDGVSVHTPDGGEQRVPGLSVPVVNGLGAGDAFGAAFGAGLLADLPLVEAIRRGNAPGPSWPLDSPAARPCQTSARSTPCWVVRPLSTEWSKAEDDVPARRANPTAERRDCGRFGRPAQNGGSTGGVLEEARLQRPSVPGQPALPGHRWGGLLPEHRLAPQNAGRRSGDAGHRWGPAGRSRAGRAWHRRRLSCSPVATPK